MNTIDDAQPSARLPRRHAWRVAGPVAAVVLLASGCIGPLGGSDDGGGSFESTGVPVLDAVNLSRPSLAFDESADPTLASHGDLLFNARDLQAGYVVGSSWCDSGTNRCVKTSGTDEVLFADQPLKSFVIEPVVDVDDPRIEVISPRALVHPITGRLEFAFDVKSAEGSWSNLYDRVTVTSGTDETAASLDGPSGANPGLVSHYELRSPNEPISGKTTLSIPFTDGIQDGERILITVSLDADAPAVERKEAPLDTRPPLAVYRSEEKLTSGEDASDDGDSAIAALIDALVDGGDTSGLVKPDTPAADAVNALGNSRPSVRLRRDPSNELGLCWQAYGRGTSCERWHAGVTSGNLLTSWSVESTPIDELVVKRAGSVPGSSATLVRSATADVVLAFVTVTNDSSQAFYVDLYQPMVQRGDEVRSALDGDGNYEVAAGKTETGTALVDSTDFDFDLVYSSGPGSGTEFRFDAGADAATGDPAGASTDLDKESVRLASLLRERRFEDAAAETAPGSPAEAYLSAAAKIFPEASIFVGGDDEPIGSTRVCAQDNTVVCTTIEVTAADADGISAFSIDDADVETLLALDRSTESGDFAATVDRAILWPKWGVFLEWSATNKSDAEVSLDSMNLLGPDGSVTESERRVYDDLVPERTINGTASFKAESLEAGIELTASGRGAVRAVSLVVPLTDGFDSAESKVELESDETNFETRAGTKLQIPGDWSEIIWFDDETNKLIGEGTPLRGVKSIHRGDMTLLAFSPEFSPVDRSTDELIAELKPVFELTDVKKQPATTADGKTVEVFSASTDSLPEPSLVVVYPGASDLIMLAFDKTGPADAQTLGAAATAISAQLGLTTS